VSSPTPLDPDEIAATPVTPSQVEARRAIAAAERGDEPLRIADSALRYRVIWNTKAGRKRRLVGPSIDENELRRLMAKYGLGDDLVSTRSDQEARAATDEARDAGVDIVACAGGDGTFDVIAERLLGARTAVGVIPLGTVMNVARQLGIPRHVEASFAILALADVHAIDVGECGGKPFFESAAVGMNAQIFGQLSHTLRGDWLAPFRAIAVALRYRPARMEIELDRGTIRSRALLTTVSIGPYNAAGFTVAPNAKLDDGLLDVTVFRHFSKPELLRHFISIAFGRRAYSPHARVYRSAHVRISGARPLPGRADGQELEMTPLEFNVRPRSLRVVTAGQVETLE
jgi:diacylglycerol kinase (ATP)